jgi:hypothetical protein
MAGGDWIARDKRGAIYHRDDHLCVYCGVDVVVDPRGTVAGKRADPTTATLDHLTPRSGGGYDAPWELATCCLGCNVDRGARTLDAWLVTFAPDRYEAVLRKLRQIAVGDAGYLHYGPPRTSALKPQFVRALYARPNLVEDASDLPGLVRRAMLLGQLHALIDSPQPDGGRFGRLQHGYMTHFAVRWLSSHRRLVRCAFLTAYAQHLRDLESVRRRVDRTWRAVTGIGTNTRSGLTFVTSSLECAEPIGMKPYADTKAP